MVAFSLNTSMICSSASFLSIRTQACVVRTAGDMRRRTGEAGYMQRGKRGDPITTASAAPPLFHSTPPEGEGLGGVCSNTCTVVGTV